MLDVTWKFVKVGREIDVREGRRGMRKTKVSTYMDGM